jgi:hypothetical protein
MQSQIDGRDRPPVDRLDDVRSRIRELEQQNSDLRAYLLQHPDDLVGSDTSLS